MMNEIYIGDKNKFAIRYIPGYRSRNGDSFHEFATLHLVLGGQIIGDPNEICFLKIWISSLGKLKDRLINNFDSLSNPAFLGRSDDEIFELVWKANQLEDEFNPLYKHLPVLDSSLWAFWHISMDETTDAWSITLTVDKGDLKFIWKGLRSPCPEDRLNKLYSIIVEKELILKSIEFLIDKVENEIVNYPIKD